MAPYTLAEFAIPAGQRLISLAQNESLRAPSPRVARAISNHVSQLAQYPDPEWKELRKALSQLHDIDQQSILCGVGSMEIIQCIAHAWLDASATVVTTQYAYAFINTVARYTDANIEHVEEDAFTVSIDNIIAAADENTTMVFLANPGNPTGTRIPRAEIRRLRNNIDPDTLLVIDEAYAEFSDQCDDYLFDLTGSTQTVILRTFSKAYGLAGLRVGWGAFEASIAEQVRKLLNPNNISLLSQVAATACVQDQAYMLETCRQTAYLRDALINNVKGVGLEPPASQTNFVLLPFESAEAASRVDAQLRQQGMVMRSMAGYRLPHCLRLTIVNQRDMDFVQENLLSAIAEEC
ncbi:hypothetical protein AB833_04980 [Chromatiales bacterium (ex Bugula neritina AB1)]|nr:hypothetical protein AB833_04980 [Chromatiales bacterium (ex Bugula neritina AB1)]